MQQIKIRNLQGGQLIKEAVNASQWFKKRQKKMVKRKEKNFKAEELEDTFECLLEVTLNS